MLHMHFSLVALEAKPETYFVKSYISASHLHNYRETFTGKKNAFQKLTSPMLFSID